MGCIIILILQGLIVSLLASPITRPFVLYGVGIIIILYILLYISATIQGITKTKKGKTSDPTIIEGDKNLISKFERQYSEMLYKSDYKSLSERASEKWVENLPNIQRNIYGGRGPIGGPIVKNSSSDDSIKFWAELTNDILEADRERQESINQQRQAEKAREEKERAERDSYVRDKLKDVHINSDATRYQTDDGEWHKISSDGEYYEDDNGNWHRL